MTFPLSKKLNRPRIDSARVSPLEIWHRRFFLCSAIQSSSCWLHVQQIKMPPLRFPSWSLFNLSVQFQNVFFEGWKIFIFAIRRSSHGHCLGNNFRVSWLKCNRKSGGKTFIFVCTVLDNNESSNCLFVYSRFTHFDGLAMIIKWTNFLAYTRLSTRRGWIVRTAKLPLRFPSPIRPRL